MDPIKLKKDKPFNNKLCILCQLKKQLHPISTAEGRERIREVAIERKDKLVLERIKLYPENFVYHMDNECYKKYVHKTNIEKAVREYHRQESDELDAVSSGSLSQAATGQTDDTTDQSTSTTPKNVAIENVIKDIMSDLRDGTRFTLSYVRDSVEGPKITNRDVKSYLESVFGEEIKFVKPTSANQPQMFYLSSTNIDSSAGASGSSSQASTRQTSDVATDTSTSMPKDVAIKNVIKGIMNDLRDGKGFTLSYIRDSVEGPKITNRDVKSCLESVFGEEIEFVKPTSANQPQMFYLSSAVKAANMADLIRSTDNIQETAKTLRGAFLSVDFDLTDKFMDEQNIKSSWYQMKIPSLILKFFAELFNFKLDKFHMRCDEMDGLEEDDDEDDSNEISYARYLKILSVFQMIYYVIHNGKKKTPLHVLNGIALHDGSRSSSLIKSFNHISASISYDEILRIRNDLAMFTVLNCNDNVPIPSHFKKESYTTAAFDNFDHNEATLSGLSSSHDTVSVLFQDEACTTSAKPKISETMVKHGSRSFTYELPCQELKEYVQPPKVVTLPPEFKVSQSLSTYDSKVKIQKEILWNLCRLESINQNVPNWAAFNSLISSEKPSKQIVAFLPLIAKPYRTVYTALKIFQDVLRQLDQNVLSVACDEGVYRIARHITLSSPTEFTDIVLVLGSFHMTKVALACVGRYIKGGGADHIFIENSVFGEIVTESVMSGSNYVRSFKGMLLLSEALQRIQLEEFFKENETTKYDVELRTVTQLQLLFEQRNFTEVKNKVSEYLKSPHNKILNDFKLFIKKRRKESELFLYWDKVIEMISLIKDLVRADRERDWLLHVETVEKLQPIFAIFDRTNYIRWSSIYLEDMKMLPITSPETYENFMNGKFAIRRSSKSFVAVGADMCLEQTINRSKKSISGVIGATRKKKFVIEWELVYHEILGVSNLYRDITKVSATNYELSNHHDLTQTRTVQMENHITDMVKYIIEHDNPFAAGSQPLRNIITQQVVQQEIKNYLLNVFTIGLKAYEKLRSERFLLKSKTISDVIHRHNLCSFDGSIDTESSSANKGKRKLALAQRTIDLARERNYSLKELFKYELVETRFLFDSEGFFSKTNKSLLITELEKDTSTFEKFNASELGRLGPVALIVDVMSYLRKIPQVNQLNTFGQFADTFCKSISDRMAPETTRIDFVFDSYKDNSPKHYERMRRAAGGSIEIYRISDDTPLPIQMQKFWSSSSNKLKLQHYLKTYILTGKHFKIELYCSAICGTERSLCLSKKSLEADIEEHYELDFESLEEADVRLMPHILHCSKSGFKQLVLVSPDTDVVVLCLYHWVTFYEHGLKELWMRIGSGSKKRYLAIHLLSSKLGLKMCSVLPALHILSGSDNTSKFGTKHSALQANPIQHLTEFGKKSKPTEEVLELAESFLTQVLKKGTNHTTMNELRCHMYFQLSKNKTIEDLPPSSSATRQHILRSYYNTYCQINCLNPNLVLDVLDITKFGYKKEEEYLIPTTGVQMYPDESELVPSCTCGKCARKTCGCFSGGLGCCSFCKCKTKEKDECRNRYSKLISK